MSTLRVGLTLLVAALCGVEQLLGQTVAWITTGFPGRRLYAWDMCSAGDVDQDGIEDILCGLDAPCSNPCQKSVLWFLSGSNGSLLREVVAPAALGACFGPFSSAGFVNGDSVPDYIAIRRDLVGVIGEVRDGLADTVLWTFPGGATGGWGLTAVLGDLDLNGDGNRDFLAASYQTSELRAYSHGGALLYTLQGLAPGPSFPPLGIGLSLVKLGDVDDDGRDDFAMGASDPSGRGGAVVVSGATGQYLRICYGELPGDILGFYITDCGDLDGDGYVDFAVGNGGTPAVSRGVVRVFSSRTGAVLRQWTKSASFVTWSSSMSSRGVDLDGDGLGDMLISDPWVGGSGGGMPGGTVYTYSGRDGSLIHEINGQSAPGTPQAGWSGTLAAGWAILLRPRAGERIGTVVVPNNDALFGSGSTPTCAHSYGALVAYHGLPRTAATIGPACAGNLTRPPNIGMASLGAQGVRIHLSNASPNSTALLLLGLSTTQFYGVPLPLPLDAIGLPGCQLRTAVEIACTAVAGTVGTAAGHTQLDLPIPVTTAVQGAWTVSAQWWVLGDTATFPGGMSQALRWDY
ncbi:MAG: VCBS repeat-containing protein [Planctomycetes bacterium]|jgi:hypothetical protein|nr:VCBS repeat-containing protein [Planctomycetota bacterium]